MDGWTGGEMATEYLTKATSGYFSRLTASLGFFTAAGKARQTARVTGSHGGWIIRQLILISVANEEAARELRLTLGLIFKPETRFLQRPHTLMVRL